MNWQPSYLVKERSYSSDSGVIYIDLPKNEQISLIMVEFIVSNTAAASRLYSRTVMDVLKNVSVLLEGSKDAWNAPPEVGGYFAFVQQGFAPQYDIRERGETVVRLPIIFGRYPFDEEYFLDTARYTNAQLQLDYELNTTYETSGSTEVTVYFYRPLSKLSGRGFVRSRVVNKYTSIGSAEIKQIPLPTGLPWLHVGTRIWDIDAFIEASCTDLDLNIDQGRLHLFDGRMEDLKALNDQLYGVDNIAPRYWAMTMNGAMVQHLAADPVRITWSHYAAASVVYGSSAIWSNRHQLQATGTDDVAIAVERDLVVTAIGGHLFSCLSLGNFFKDPFVAPGGGDAFIEYTLAAATIEVETFVQELVEGAL